jgi:hypothetical protein
MSDQSNVLSRIVRWGAVGVLICAAIALYFRIGVHLEPFTAASHQGATADSTP